MAFYTDELLLEQLDQGRRTNLLLKEILEELRIHTRLLRRILAGEKPPFPTHFTIQETSMVALDPGQSPQLTATPQPAGSSLGSVVPTWTSSDPVNAPVTVDPTGLIATVALSSAIAVGASVTLTVSATNPANAQVAEGTLTFTVGAPPAEFPTSFTIAQSS